MRHCQVCGGFVLQIKRGGCGGNGSYHRCTVCGQVFEQLTGGMVGTAGGETFKPVEMSEVELFLGKLPTVKEWQLQIMEQSKLRTLPACCQPDSTCAVEIKKGNLPPCKVKKANV